MSLKKRKQKPTWSAGDVVRVRYYQKKNGRIPRIGYAMVANNGKDMLSHDPHVYIHWLWSQSSLSSYVDDFESYGFGPTDYAIHDEEWSAVPCSMILPAETIPVVRFKCRFHPRFELALLTATRPAENEKELSTRILTLEQKWGELTSSLSAAAASSSIPTVAISPLELPYDFRVFGDVLLIYCV
jgi:hypothetical protein